MPQTKTRPITRPVTRTRRAMSASGKPSRVYIYGKPVEIRYIHKGEDGPYGETNTDKMTIEINLDQDDRSFHSTLLHEMFHAALSMSGISHMLDGIPGLDVEEAIVRALENSLQDSLSIKFEPPISEET